MAIRSAPFVARLQQLRAFVTGQRPACFERRLRRMTLSAAAGETLSPASAWELYSRSMSRPCFADKGWLVQFGVYSFSGRERFEFSMVRQFDALEHWNDEYIQLDLRVSREPDSDLRSLGSFNEWSFDHESLAMFRRHCEQHPGVAAVLTDRRPDWRWELDCAET